jgi:hypothetical protein
VPVPVVLIILGLGITVGSVLFWPENVPATPPKPAGAPPAMTPQLGSAGGATEQSEPVAAVLRVRSDEVLVSPEPQTLTTPAPELAAPQPATTPPTAGHEAQASEMPTPSSVAVSVAHDTPVDAVRSFYRLVEQHQFDRAARLWTPRMWAEFPPAENIDSRFGQTHEVVVESAEVVALDARAGRATGAVVLREVFGSPPTARRYTGTWDLVRGDDGWLLDQPDLKLQ